MGTGRLIETCGCRAGDAADQAFDITPRLFLAFVMCRLDQYPTSAGTAAGGNRVFAHVPAPCALLFINAQARCRRPGRHSNVGTGTWNNAVSGLGHGLVLGPKIESK
jgi:hypothetical protein